MSTATLPNTQVRPASGIAFRPSITATTCLLCLGLLLRFAHYLWNHVIWYDESVLLINILGKDWLQLLGPLDYEVAAPPFFLWMLRTIAVLFGDHPHLWRFPFFLGSCVTLLLTAALARRVLRPAPAALIVGLVAFSDAYIWLGCNIKPYILDACLATGLLYAYVITERWTPARRMLAYGVTAPFVLCLCYPMIFLYAGLLLAFLPSLWMRQAGKPDLLRVWTAYLSLSIAVLATFACLYFGPIHAQRVSGLVAGWENKFPPINGPAAVPSWVVGKALLIFYYCYNLIGWIVGNAMLIFYYCFNPIGAGCVLFVIGGAWRCWRNGRFDWICLCLGPLGACLLASCIKAYPFSGNRLLLFLAPGIVLMIGFGLSGTLDWLRNRPRWMTVGLVTLLLVPEVCLCCLRCYDPLDKLYCWNKADSTGAANFVKNQLHPDDLVASNFACEDASYLYYFRGDLLSLEEVATAPLDPGQRVWVLADNYTDDFRHAFTLNVMPAKEWELVQEKLFHKSTVFLFVRREYVTQRSAPKTPRRGYTHSQMPAYLP